MLSEKSCNVQKPMHAQFSFTFKCFLFITVLKILMSAVFEMCCSPNNFYTHKYMCIKRSSWQQ